MLLLLLSLVADSLGITVAPAETLRVTLEGSGAPVVLIPGLMGSAASFRKLTGLLGEDGYRTVVIEPLGIGFSSRPADADYSLGAQADRIAAVLDSLDLGPAVLVAHSLGAAMAFRLAYRRPDLVRGLISLEGGPTESAATNGVRSAARYAPLIRLFGAGAVRGKLKKALNRASGDASWVTDSVVADYTAGLTRDLGASLRAFGRMASSREAEPLAPHLAEIRCPVVLVVGLAPHPEAVPESELARLDGAIPRFTVDSVVGAGHHLQEERPTLVAEIVEGVERGIDSAVTVDAPASP